MSSPSEPVDTVSISIDLSFLPSFMIEPLPKARSIWVSAASRAFDLSMDELSTTRSAAVMSGSHMLQDSGQRQTAPRAGKGRPKLCTPFVLMVQCSFSVLHLRSGTGPFRYPLVPFEFGSGPFSDREIR